MTSSEDYKGKEIVGVGGQIVANQRRDKVNFYLDIAETIAINSTCLNKQWGAIIVNDTDILSMGYIGAPRGRQNCIDIQQCYKHKWDDCDENARGVCRGVHAEANAIISARRADMEGSSLYLVGLDIRNGGYVKDPHCCKFCKMMIINAKIRDVYIRINKMAYKRETVLSWVDADDTLLDFPE